MIQNVVDLLPTPTGDLRVESRSPLPTDPLLSLIIPTYNERHNITQLITQLSDLLDRHLRHQYELILVDDDSADGTWQTGLALAQHFPALQVMCRRGEKGLSSAVIRGWQQARGQVLGVMDADLQHPPEIVLQLWTQMAQGADLAVASRHVTGGGVSEWSLLRRTLSRGAQVLGLLILPDVLGRVSDPMSGYFMVRREAISNHLLNPKGYKILLEVLGRGQVHRIREVGYVFQERSEGESKVTWRQYVEYLQHLFTLRSHRGIQFSAMKLPMARFLRFATVGFSGVFVDYGVFYLLFSHLGLGLTLSNVLSAEVAIFNNFLWNDAWTFADLSHRQAGGSARLKRFLKFNLICLAGLTWNTLIVNLLVKGVGMNAYLAKLIAIVIVTFWNFWVNLKLSWRVTDVSQEHQP